MHTDEGIKKMTLEEGYGIVGAGFHDKVYVIRGVKIYAEWIFSGLSLMDAVKLKESNSLFLTFDEANKELALRYERSY
jgi:hypothetical protein